MTQNYKDKIYQALEARSQELGVIKTYFFGSAMTGATTPNDIDILIIYTESHQPHKIREILFANNGFLPLHLTFMLPEEERETQFIKSQKCDLIYAN